MYTLLPAVVAQRSKSNSPQKGSIGQLETVNEVFEASTKRRETLRNLIRQCRKEERQTKLSR